MTHHRLPPTALVAGALGLALAAACAPMAPPPAPDAGASAPLAPAAATPTAAAPGTGRAPELPGTAAASAKKRAPAARPKLDAAEEAVAEAKAEDDAADKADPFRETKAELAKDPKRPYAIAEYAAWGGKDDDGDGDTDFEGKAQVAHKGGAKHAITFRFDDEPPMSEKGDVLTVTDGTAKVTRQFVMNQAGTVLVVRDGKTDVTIEAYGKGNVMLDGEPFTELAPLATKLAGTSAFKGATPELFGFVHGRGAGLTAAPTRSDPVVATVVTEAFWICADSWIFIANGPDAFNPNSGSYEGCHSSLLCKPL